MKNNKTILYILFIPFLLMSCAFKDQKAIEEVKQMQTTVNKVEKDFNTIDFDNINQIKKQYDESIAYLKKYYYSDTIDHEFIERINYYRNVKNAYKSIGKNKNIMQENITLMQNQLGTLLTDLENNSIQGEQLKEALENEQRNTSQLDSAMTVFKQNVETLIHVHDSVAGYIRHKIRTF